MAFQRQLPLASKCPRILLLNKSRVPGSSRQLEGICRSSTAASQSSDKKSQSSQTKGQSSKVPQGPSQQKKTMAQLDEELRQKLEERSGGGGEAGLELEGGKPVAMKRSVKDNMFRLI